MIVTPDDPARNLPWYYTGPKGFRLPDAPISAYLTYVGLILAAGALLFIVAVPPAWWVIGTLLTAAVGVLAFRKMSRRDMNYTVQYWRDSFRAEMDTPRPPAVDYDGPGHTTRLSPAMFDSWSDRP